MALSRDLVARYSRQIVMPEIGVEGQERLAKARVACIGIGGLGAPVAQYLAAAGVGRLTLIDGDRVAVSNLHRQVIYATADAGALKVEIAKARLGALNPTIELVAIAEHLDQSNAGALLSGHDLVIDGSDNFATKYLLNDLCLALGLPWIFGAVTQYHGQVAVFAGGGPCYRCLYPEPTAVANCATAGVLGPVAGVVGSVQAICAVEALLGVPPVGQLLVFHGRALRLESFALPLRPGCACTTMRDSTGSSFPAARQ